MSDHPFKSPISRDSNPHVAEPREPGNLQAATALGALIARERENQVFLDGLSEYLENWNEL